MWSQKISIPLPTEVPWERGVLKAKIFKGMYEFKLEFQEGWSSNQKTPSVEGVWINSGTKQYRSNSLGNS